MKDHLKFLEISLPQVIQWCHLEQHHKHIGNLPQYTLCVHEKLDFEQYAMLMNCRKINLWHEDDPPQDSQVTL